jgi:hypothetical protein
MTRTKVKLVQKTLKETYGIKLSVPKILELTRDNPMMQAEQRNIGSIASMIKAHLEDLELN